MNVGYITYFEEHFTIKEVVQATIATAMKFFHKKQTLFPLPRSWYNTTKKTSRKNKRREKGRIRVILDYFMMSSKTDVKSIPTILNSMIIDQRLWFLMSC